MVKALIPEAAAMMTVREVAQRLRCAVSTVYQLIEVGKLGAFHIGRNRGAIRVSEEQLSEYLESSKSVPDAASVRKPPRSKLKHIKL